MERLLAELHGGLRVPRLHRREKRNVLHLAAKQQLVAALRDADADGVRAVVLTGGPTDFVAGTDTDQMRHLRSADHLVSRKGEVFEVPQVLSTLTVAAVEGFARGDGFELAISADLGVAGAYARFGVPEARIGPIPRGGGLARSVRAASRHRAFTGQPFCTGDPRSGGRQRFGGARRSHGPGGGAGHRILAFSPASIAVNCQEAPAAHNSALPDSIAFERRPFELMLAIEDHAERLAAFVEHRPADFQER